MYRWCLKLKYNLYDVSNYGERRKPFNHRPWIVQFPINQAKFKYRDEVEAPALGVPGNTRRKTKKSFSDSYSFLFSLVSFVVLIIFNRNGTGEKTLIAESIKHWLHILMQKTINYSRGLKINFHFLCFSTLEMCTVAANAAVIKSPCHPFKFIK